MTIDEERRAKHAAYMREWSRKHPRYRHEQVLEHQRQKRAQNPEKERAYREKYRARNRAKYHADPAAAKARSDAYRLTHKDYYREYHREKHLLDRARDLGISHEEFALIRPRMDGSCEICGREGRLMMDHDHKTMKLRGLLCKRCNTGLGVIGDTLDHVRKVIAYLERSLNV